MSNKEVLIGFSMHPRWLTGSTLDSFLNPLREHGLRSLEFEVDSHLKDWRKFEPLMEECKKQGMEICFHAPYRPPFSLSGFQKDRREEIIKTSAPMWSLANAWAEKNEHQTEMVIHGASAKNGDAEALRNDTRGFIIWALENFPNLTIALENPDIARNDFTKFGGGKRNEILALVKEIGDPRLGICWDTGHDVRHGIHHDPPREWLEHVCHVHVHELDDHGDDHYPLVYHNVPNEHWLRLLMKSGMTGTITLELKGGNLLGWRKIDIDQALVHSLKKINEALV